MLGPLSHPAGCVAVFLNQSMEKKPGVSSEARTVPLEAAHSHVHKLHFLFFNRFCGATHVLFGIRKPIQQHCHIRTRHPVFLLSLVSQIQDPPLSASHSPLSRSLDLVRLAPGPPEHALPRSQLWPPCVPPMRPLLSYVQNPASKLRSDWSWGLVFAGWGPTAASSHVGEGRVGAGSGKQLTSFLGPQYSSDNHYSIPSSLPLCPYMELSIHAVTVSEYSGLSPGDLEPSAVIVHRPSFRSPSTYLQCDEKLVTGLTQVLLTGLSPSTHGSQRKLLKCK